MKVPWRRIDNDGLDVAHDRRNASLPSAMCNTAGTPFVAHAQRTSTIARASCGASNSSLQPSQAAQTRTHLVRLTSHTRKACRRENPPPRENPALPTACGIHAALPCNQVNERGLTITWPARFVAWYKSTTKELRAATLALQTSRTSSSLGHARIKQRSQQDPVPSANSVDTFEGRFGRSLASSVGTPSVAIGASAK